MCTAITFKNGDHYFGRNLDLEYSYKETVTITPRNYSFHFRNGKKLSNHYAMIGMAFVYQNYPLYYDATNEKGLSIAGLNFPENAVYRKKVENESYIASFEFIPWLLGQCATVSEARGWLNRCCIADISFDEHLPASPLHWLVADQNESITVESVAEGLKIYNNPVGVLTNNPPFDYHMYHLTAFLNLTSDVATNRFSDELTLKPFSKGMGGIGLPGDLSSPSRFVRAAFVKWNARCKQTEIDNVSQFFHILGAVEQQRGCTQVHDELYEITHYTSCCNTERGIYYYRTYNNSQLSAVDMQRENLDRDALISYPLIAQQQINFQN